jgi:hypothetical protein
MSIAKRNRPSARIPSFGSVSTGTLRPEDLADTFAAELRYYAPRMAAKLAKDFETPDNQTDNAIDDATAEYVDALQDALSEVASRRAFCYFGTLEGDGADFGFWFDLASYEQGVQDREIHTFSDASRMDESRRQFKREPADNRPQYFAVISDHGNISLYTLYGRTPVCEVV